MQVYYVNADDSKRGIMTKQRILAPHGIRQLAPGYQGFEPKILFRLMANAVQNETASGCAIILDTLKKWCDLLDGRSVNQTTRHIEAFVSAGGTVVALGHVNKNKKEDGALVYKGTSDVLDDWHSVWLGTPVEEGEFTNVNFAGLKRRGDQPKSVGFRYRKTLGDYIAMFDSVERIPVDEQERVALTARALREQEYHCLTVDAIKSAIADGAQSKGDVIDFVAKITGESRRHIESVLAQFTGGSASPGALWQVRRGENGRHIFEVNEQ